MEERAANSQQATGTGDSADPLASAMAAYQQGSVAGFETVYAAVAGPIRGYLRALVRDATLADDLLQETFLQVHRVRHTFQPQRPVRPWLYAIARNVVLMHRRASFRRARHETIADEALPEVPVAAEIQGLGDRDAVWGALARLPEARREPVVLHHVLGMSFKEVGAVLGITEGAAKVRSHRGLVELRVLMGVEVPGGST